MPLPTGKHNSAEPQTLDEILEWYRGIVDALRKQRDAARRETPCMSTTESGKVDADYDLQRQELDRLTMLNLVASAEAAIKLDYSRRVGGKLKDKVAIAYQKWHSTLSSQEQLRPNLEAILDKLKRSQVMDNHIVGRFRECLRVRHWLAHGRYFAKPVGVDLFDPDEIYNRALALLNALPS